MSSVKDGGTAFPIPATDAHAGEGGMSLRDYFAVHADQPGRAEVCKYLDWQCRDVNARKLADAPFFDDLWNNLSFKQQIAVSAAVRYAMADALLTARKET